MTCDPEGRQDYRDARWVSIERRKHFSTAAAAHKHTPVWRRSGRRYRLPGLHSNNEYLIILGTQLAAGMTLWNRCVRDLQAELPEQDFNTWIRPLQAVEDGGALRLLAPNHFVVDWLQQHYIERILEIVAGPGRGDRGDCRGGFAAGERRPDKPSPETRDVDPARADGCRVAA